MLQQTQVKKVQEYYQKFVNKFPDVESLAEATLQDLLKTWEGLGYYARARNLHKAAQVVVENLGGEIPADYAAFRALPGVGEYIAAAVQSIAFNRPYAVVDGNVKRVLARLFLIDAAINQSSSTKIFQEKADLLLDRYCARDFQSGDDGVGCDRLPAAVTDLYRLPGEYCLSCISRLFDKRNFRSDRNRNLCRSIIWSQGSSTRMA